MHKAAIGIRNLGLTFDLVLTSPYVRARQTADIVVKALDLKGRVTECRELTPEVDPAETIDYLTQWKRSPSTLLVGHEPHLGNLASLFLGRPGMSLVLRKGGLARFDFEDGPTAGSGSLIYWLTPKQLRFLSQAPVGVK